LTVVTREKEALEIKYSSLCGVKQEPRAPQLREERKKRVRRTASEITREFACHVESCGKSYGTEASLLQHIKLKHPIVYENKEHE
jgi:hypothetical protein